MMAEKDERDRARIEAGREGRERRMGRAIIVDSPDDDVGGAFASRQPWPRHPSKEIEMQKPQWNRRVDEWLSINILSLLLLWEERRQRCKKPTNSF